MRPVDDHEETPMAAPFVWFDLTTANGEDVRAFYVDLFGWTVAPGMGDYHDFMTDGEQPWAGIAAGDAGRWVPYVVVDDLDSATKQATALGGTVVRPRTTGPAGSSVLVADPGGAVVALFTPAAG
jgi:predicted enzyme related to lactoylglutathione lyase